MAADAAEAALLAAACGEDGDVAVGEVEGDGAVAVALAG